MYICRKIEEKTDTYKRAYRKLGNQGLFDSEERTSMLNALGNPLERLSETINFEMFRETLEVGLYRERLTNAGAKPYDHVLMFKILVLQRMYNLSDEQTEYQIVDRTSFRNFLGLASGDKVPDAKSKLIKKAVTTSEEQHDSVPTRLLTDNDDMGQEVIRDVQPRCRFGAKCRQKHLDQPGLQRMPI